MNVFLFMYMEAIQKRDECAGYDGNVVVFGGLLCLVLFFVRSYFYFFTEPFTS